MINLQDLINEIKHNIGSAPTDINLVQKIERFDIEKKNDKAGWIIGSTWNHNGEDYAAATYGSWKDTQGPYQWKSWKKEHEANNKAFRKTLQNLNKKRDEELKAEAEERRQEIIGHFEFFKECPKDNFYLVKKQVTVTENLMQDSDGNLIVPMYENFKRELTGYQRILNQEKYNKQFPSGQVNKGRFFYFGNPRLSDYVYLCEGVATGATIYELTGTPVVVAFQANNIPTVASKIKHELNGCKMVIAADNDQAKKNTGMIWARKAKDKIANISIVMPSFPKESLLTDFNDLYVTAGADETVAQLAFNESDFIEVEPLGYDSSKYYFYSTATKDIRSYTIEKLRTGNLIEMAPESYWAQKFVPNYDKETLEPLESCNWKKSAEKIIAVVTNAGQFTGAKVRGVGSWADGSNHVINTGTKLYVNGEETSYGKNNALKKFYIPSKHGEVLDYVSKSFRYDFKPLLEAFRLVDFGSPRDRILCLGYLAFCQVFTTQRWRPHIWVRADKGTGKSSLLEFCAEFLMNATLFQDSTGAGIRQSVGMDSRICLIDEAEGESNRTRQLVELARQSSSGGASKIVRGTTHGSALEYKPELTFFFASIRAAELTPADESRIFQISMKKPKKNSAQRNKERESLLYDAMALREPLFRFMNDELKQLEHLTKELKIGLQSSGFDNRFADQYAPVLAAYSMINPELSLEHLVQIVCEGEKREDETKDYETDQYEFFDYFMSTMIRDGSTEKSLGAWLKDFNQGNPERKKFIAEKLGDYGVIYRPRAKDWVFVKNENMIKLRGSSRYRNYFAQMESNMYFQKTRVTKGYAYMFSELGLNELSAEQ